MALPLQQRTPIFARQAVAGAIAVKAVRQCRRTTLAAVLLQHIGYGHAGRAQPVDGTDGASQGALLTDSLLEVEGAGAGSAVVGASAGRAGVAAELAVMVFVRVVPGNACLTIFFVEAGFAVADASHAFARNWIEADFAALAESTG